MNSRVMVHGLDRKNDRGYHIRDSLSKFLAIPLLTLVSFALLGLIAVAVERSSPLWLSPVRAYIGRYLFATHDATRTFLGAVSGGLITMTSIIFSMLLLMLQQSASKMGNMIYDQFLNRRRNQIYVGIIVGSVILSLIQSAAVSDSFNPIVGATLVLLVVFISLGMLAYFLYSAINQMRPEFIIGAIKRRTLQARKEQLLFLERTRREPQLEEDSRIRVHTATSGYLDKIDLDHLANCLRDAEAEVEVVIRVTVGAYVSYGDCVAEVVAVSRQGARQVAERLGRAFHFTGEPNIAGKPAFGLQQLEMVAWTENSSAKQNPETGLMVTQALRDLLARWMEEEQEAGLPKTEPLAVVYADGVLARVLEVFESLAVVSAESKQQQNYAEILAALSLLLSRLTPSLLDRAEEAIRRTLPSLQDHILVHKLDVALLELADTLDAMGRTEMAALVYEARQKKIEQVEIGQAGVAGATEEGELSPATC